MAKYGIYNESGWEEGEGDPVPWGENSRITGTG